MCRAPGSSVQWWMASRHLLANRTAVQRVTCRGGWFDARPPNPRTVVVDSESSHAFWALVLDRERHGPADAANREAVAMSEDDTRFGRCGGSGPVAEATPLRALTPQPGTER